jgi:hypothetical protein
MRVLLSISLMRGQGDYFRAFQLALILLMFSHIEIATASIEASAALEKAHYDRDVPFRVLFSLMRGRIDFATSQSPD